MVSVKKQVARAKNETGGYADLTRSSNLTFRTRITTGNKNKVVLKAPPQDAKVRIMWHTHPNGCKARSSKCGLPTFSAIDVGNFLKQGINDKVVCHVLFTKEKRIFVLYLTDMFRARVSHVTDDVCQKVINDFKIMENSSDGKTIRILTSIYSQRFCPVIRRVICFTWTFSPNQGNTLTFGFADKCN